MRHADKGRRDILAHLERGPVETSGYCDGIQNALLVEGLAEAFVTAYGGHSSLRLSDAGRVKLAELRAVADAERAERDRYVWEDGFAIAGPFDSEAEYEAWESAWRATGHGYWVTRAVVVGFGPEQMLAGPFATQEQADQARDIVNARESRAAGRAA